jgi:hypothetical protein
MHQTTQKISLYNCPYIKLAKLEKREWKSFCPVAGGLRGGDPNYVYTGK